MHSVAHTLFQRIQEINNKRINDGVECKLIVPGITQNIAKDLNERFLSTEMTYSYLIVDPSDTPNPEKRWMKADGATSKREGSFIFITTPGSIPMMPDSIKGSGGAVKNFLFNEEWPWIPNDYDEINFQHDFLPSFFKTVFNTTNLGEAEVAIIELLTHKQGILNGLIQLNRSEKDKILFEDILNSYSHTNIFNSPKESFLFHCGMPNSTSTDETSAYLEQLSQAAKEINEKLRYRINREEIIERAIEVLKIDAKEAFDLLDRLMDRLLRNKFANSSALYFRDVLQNDYPLWQKFTIENIREVFGLPKPFKSYGFSLANIDILNADGVKSIAKKEIYTFNTGTIAFDFNTSAEPGENLKVTVAPQKQTGEITQNIVDNHCRIEINLNQVGQNLKKLTLTFHLLDAEGKQTNEKLKATIHICGKKRGNFLLLQNEENKDDLHLIESTHLQEETLVELKQNIEIDWDVRVFLFSCSVASWQFYQGIRENKIPITLSHDGANNYLYELIGNFNPAKHDDGYIELLIENETIPDGYFISLEAEKKMSGHFTFDQECYNVILNNNVSKSRSINEILNGEIDSKNKRKLYGGLAGRTHTTENLARIIADSESRNNYFPYLVSISEAFPKQFKFHQTPSGINTINQKRVFNSQSSPLSKATYSLLEKYSAARCAILTFLQDGLEQTEISRPLYALMPTYNSAQSEAICNLIKEYLFTYYQIIDFANQNHDANWIDMFVLTHLDTITFYKEPEFTDAPLTDIFLLTPWHPLVLVKRYYLEEIFHKLIKKVSRGYYNSIQKKYHTLTYYLEHLEPFKWINTHEGLCSCHSTNDYSIIQCFATNSTPNHKIEVENFITTSFGINSTYRHNFEDNRIKKYFDHYQRAFPIKRSIHCRIANDYKLEEVIPDLQKILYQDDSNYPTLEGLMLVGGIHIYSKNDLPSDFEPNFQNPPICIYKECAPSTVENIDLDILPPLSDVEFKLTTTATAKTLYQARGECENVLFRYPTMIVTKNQNDIPESYIYEYDQIFINDKSKEEWNQFCIADCFLEILKKICNNQFPLTHARFNLPSEFKNQWSVLPGSKIDPAIVSEFVKNQTDDRVLWDFNIDLQGGSNSYFIFSNLTKAVIESIRNCEIFRSAPDDAKLIVKELSNQGIAISNETLKTTNKAWGVIGVAAAIRLFQNENVFSNDHQSVGFILPVDSFLDFLGPRLEMGDDVNRKRFCDLVAIQLFINEHILTISAAAVECKYSNNEFSDNNKKKAFEQAEQTFNRVKLLLSEAKESDGILERIALQKMVYYGLRLCQNHTTKGNNDFEKERKIFQFLIAGKIEYRKAFVDKILVITQNLSRIAESQLSGDSLTISLDRENWPGVNEGPQLAKGRQHLNHLFAIDFENVKENPSTCQENQAQFPSSTDDLAKVKKNSQANLTKSSETDGVKIKIGDDCSGLNKRAAHFWPSNTNLNQLNIGIVGDLGTGKTQLIKSLIYQISNSGVNNRGKVPKFLILDTKRDYDGSGGKINDKKFVDDINSRVVSPFKMPLNLFDIRMSEGVSHPAFERASFFIDVLTKIYEGIGPIQQTKLREAIIGAYQDRGYKPYQDSYATFIAPTIYDVFNNYKLLTKDKIDAPHSLMNELVMAEIFDERAENCIDFRSFFTQSIVVSLGQIATFDRPLKLVLVIFLNLYNQYMLSCNQEEFIGENPRLRSIDSFLLIDEANKIMEYEFPVLNDILIKGRAFGIGVMLSSQYLSHFKQTSQNYTEPLLTWFVHKVPNINKRDLESIGITNVTERLIQEIKELEPHKALYKSLQYNGTIINCIPYYKLS